MRACPFPALRIRSRVARDATSPREEVANPLEWKAGFRRTSNLPVDREVERQFSVKPVEEIETVHADDALAASEGDQAVFGKAAVADEQASRPRGLLLQLSVECVKVGSAGLRRFHFASSR